MKKIFFGLLVLGIMAGVYLGYKQFTAKPKGEVMPSPNVTESKKLTLEEIGKHDRKDDCWLLIEGKVYDVTDYVKSGFHPGKEAILMGCGKDATELFNNRPNGSGAHSERARGYVQKYYIGDLVN